MGLQTLAMHAFGLAAHGLGLAELKGLQMHTAVKIEPHYQGPVVHVLDASRGVPVAQTLLDAVRSVDFMEDIHEQVRFVLPASQRACNAVRCSLSGV